MIDESQSSLAMKQRVCQVVCHEISHQVSIIHLAVRERGCSVL
jgi:hypothetical protein